MCCQKITFKEPKLPLAVVVAQTHWDEPPRMRHHVTQQLMRWFNVLFVEFFPVERVTDRIRTVEDRLLVFTPQTGTAPSVRWYANDPIKHGWVNRRYAKHIERAIASLPGEPKLLFNFSYDFPEIMRSPLYRHKSYICNDEFPRMQKGRTGGSFLKRIAQPLLLQWYEDRVARSADRCFTPHYPLRDKLKRVNPRVDMLFHGHNYPVNPTRPTGGKPIKIGYAGFLDWRLIDSWLKAVADEDDMQLWLIGPRQGPNMERICNHPKVKYVPPVSEQKLLDHLIAMDVLIMPYGAHDPAVAIMTTNSKIFQYIAACRPIVIASLDHYIEMPPGVIYRARTAEEFVAQIRWAHEEDCDDYREIRAQIARDNTWDKRGEMLVSTINRDLDGQLTGFASVALPAADAPAVTDSFGDQT